MIKLSHLKVCDLLVFLYSSTKLEMRLKHMDELIEIYRNSLISNLREFLKDCDEKEIEKIEALYSLDEINFELANRSLFGLGMTFWIMPAITLKTPNTNDIDSLMNTIMDADKHDEIISSLQSNEYHVRIQELISEFESRGFLKNIV